MTLKGSVCFVLGNEEYGASPQIAALASNRVGIPMHRQIDSLEVAFAGAVFLYDAIRQRVKSEAALRRSWAIIGSNQEKRDSSDATS